MRVAIMASAAFDEKLREQIANDETPQRDFYALVDALNAEIIDTYSGQIADRSAAYRLFDTMKITWRVFKKRKDYDLIVTDVERVGLMLAMLLKITRSKKRHMMICHGRIGRRFDSALIKTLRLHTKIHRFICYGPALAGRLTEVMGVPERQVVVLQHAADHRFWRPLDRQPERLIASAGMSRRDYPTLIEAVRGMDVFLDIAAFSPWARTDQFSSIENKLPDNVRMERRGPQELRELYARALFVAVPLEERITQVGSLVIYEAMAVGKAVVVTRTTGQTGMGLIRENETGLYVAPGDVQGWKAAIQYMLDHPEEAERMGRNARKFVENGMNMDGFVETFREMIDSLDEAGKLPSGDRRAIGA